jgi:hypothetical protein
MDRISTAGVDDWIKGKILDSAIDNKPQYTRIFYYGIVINNKDKKNSNRIKIRIPLIDDNIYNGRTKEEGDNLLPWCSPISRNFIATPENNSIVLVAIMDPKLPLWGRIYFDSITDLSEKDIFDVNRLTPETNTYNNWENAQKHHNIILNSIPQKSNEYNTKDNVEYHMGIKGKGNNRVTLDEDNIIIYQNEGKGNNESLLSFTNNIKMEAGDKMELLSKLGGNHYHPVFDEPLYNYLSEINDLLKSIIIVQNSNPSLCNTNMLPNLPSPDAIKLVSKLSNMYIKFNKLKLPGNGASKQISIN